MALISESTFADLLAGCDDESLAAFLADLWAARGWETEHYDRSVVAEQTDPLPRQERLVAVTSPRWTDEVPTEATTVVAPRGGGHAEDLAAAADADLLTAGDLYGMVAYGVDRDEADAVLQRHFGVSVRQSDDERRGGWLASLAAVDWRTATATLAVLLLASAVATALVGSPLTGGPRGNSTAPESAGAAGTTVEQFTTTPTTAPETSTVQPIRRPSCTLGPQEVATLHLKSLRNNDPARDNGLRTVWNYLSIQSRNQVGSFENFTDLIETPLYRPLLTANSSTLLNGTRDGPVFTQQVSVTNASGTAWYQFTYYQSRAPGFGLRGCWLLANVARMPPPPNATNALSANETIGGSPLSSGNVEVTPAPNGTTTDDYYPGDDPKPQRAPPTANQPATGRFRATPARR